MMVRGLVIGATLLATSVAGVMAQDVPGGEAAFRASLKIHPRLDMAGGIHGSHDCFGATDVAGEHSHGASALCLVCTDRDASARP